MTISITFINSEYLGSHFYWQWVPGFTLLLTSSTWVHTFIDSEYLGSHPLFCGIQVLLIVLVFPCCDVFFFPLVFIVFVLCFVCPIFSESLDCRFLMDHSVFFNVYLIDWKQKMPLFWNAKIKPQYLISSTQYLISSTHSWIVRWLGLIYGVERHFLQYFSYVVAVSFIGEGDRSTLRKLLTCRKSPTYFIT